MGGWPISTICLRTAAARWRNSMNGRDSRRSREEHVRIFDERVLEDSQLNSRTSFERPRAVILAGQPGAGKGNLVAVARNDMRKDVVVVDPDALRDCHPSVYRFRNETPYTWPGRPNAGASADKVMGATVKSTCRRFVSWRRHANLSLSLSRKDAPCLYLLLPSRNACGRC
ncbi:MAG: zeta toxin family protein [Pseudomonadota bacterium]